jgi:hypothetical protein
MKNIVIVAYAIAGFDWLVASMIRQGSRRHFLPWQQLRAAND